MTRRILSLGFCIAAACDAGSLRMLRPNAEPEAATPEVTEVPLADLTTFAQTVRLLHDRKNPADPRSPINPQMLYKLQDEGFGEHIMGPGDVYTQRVINGASIPKPGKNARKLSRFVHLSDLQLADDESPARTAVLDGLGDTNGAFRPQEGHGCRIVRAAVSTINALDAQEKIDFLLLGGDNGDNAQDNETDWVMQLLAPEPSMVHCDSGDDDDFPGDDPKDPFMSSGLHMPYKWVSGNHDILVQGNVKVDDYFRSLALGTSPLLGTRDYRIAGAPVVTEPVSADPRRRLHNRVELLQRVQQDGDGHGITPEIAATGKAIYTWDVPNSDLRFIAIDTSAETGGAEGLLRHGDVDNRIIPEFERARADKKHIILTGHHGIMQLTEDGGLLGFKQSDSLTTAEWLTILDRYPEILVNVVGHSHEHRLRQIDLPSGRKLFEVMTASLIDFPGQFRLIEVFDEDNSWFKIRATCVDYMTVDPLADEGRTLMYLDYVSGWGQNGTNRGGETNVELFVPKVF